jgi:deoxyribose-phosphate aldolase
MTTDMEMNVEEMIELAGHIEHTNLKPDCTKEDIIKLCEEALGHHFYGVCVPPYHVQAAKKAIISGADEVDMVMNIAAFKSGDFVTVQNDIQAVTTACHLQNRHIKVIIETAYLNTDEIEKACHICADCEVDYVKTSTGYATAGASIEIVKLMRTHLPAKIKIKASGGIKDHDFALQLLQAGATRIGTSSSLNIIGVEA